MCRIGDCVGVGCSEHGPKGKILLKQLLNFLPGLVFSKRQHYGKSSRSRSSLEPKIVLSMLEGPGHGQVFVTLHSLF